MGKQAGPSPEELEYIFECFSRGLSDREVLDEMQDTEFPVRNPRFMRDRRREFNAAKKVLEIGLKQQIDPAVAKARESHLTEIHDLLGRVVEVTRTQYVFEIELEASYRPLDLISLETNKLFDCLQQHLPFPEIWPAYYQWKEKLPLYIESCKILIRQFINDDVVKEFMSHHPDNPIWFYRPLLRFLNEIALDREPNVFSGTLPEEPEELVQEEIEERKAREKATGQHYKYYGFDSGDLEYYDPSICDSFLDTEAANNVIALFKEAKALEKQFRVPLKDALLSRSYLEATCRLCPGQSSVAP